MSIQRYGAARCLLLFLLPTIAAVSLVAGLFLFSGCGKDLAVASLPPKGQDAPAIEHHRVLWMDDPAREAVVSWTTRAKGNVHLVRYDKESRDGNSAEYRFTAEAFENGAYTMTSEDQKWSTPGYYHHVHLKDLQPSTTYYLIMESDGETSREFHFVTAPEDDRPFNLLFGGDSRIGTPEPYDHTDRQKMNLLMAALVEQNPEILALVHGGDYCATAEWRYLDRWLSDHELVTGETGRLLPIVPARGNHDLDVGFEEMFTWPQRPRDYYYSMEFSDQVSLIMLNTEISVAGDQRNWLESELERLRPENRWLFVAYHRPAYSSVRSMQDGAPRRNHWVPLFEQFNVDLVCESHDHAMKRTLPIRSHAPDFENGIIYIGDGGLGVPQRDPDPARWWLQEPGFTKAVHHVHMFEFGKKRFRIRAFGMEGSELDDFSLSPKSRLLPSLAEAGK